MPTRAEAATAEEAATVGAASKGSSTSNSESNTKLQAESEKTEKLGKSDSGSISHKSTGKGFNINDPPEGFDDPDLVGPEAASTATHPHSPKAAAAAAAAAAAVSKHEREKELESGYNDPDLFVSGGQRDTEKDSRIAQDLREYRGGRVEAMAVVQGATNVLVEILKP